MRQGCPLSPLLFNLYIGGLDKWIRNNQDGGVTVGRHKVYLLAYADDIVLLAVNAKEMQNMINHLGKYLKRKTLILNIGKSKMMVCRKGGRGGKDEKWMWEGTEIEKVKEFKYLGYWFQTNNGSSIHKSKLRHKGEIAMRRVWGIGERNFAGDIRLRIKLYDTMVNSILLYGVEIWGCETGAWLEKMRLKYLYEMVTRIKVEHTGIYGSNRDGW